MSNAVKHSPKRGSVEADSATGAMRWTLRLRDRWRWVGLTAVLGAAAGAAMGWWLWGQRDFRAEQLIGLTTQHVGLIDAEPAADRRRTLQIDGVVQRELARLKGLVGEGTAELAVTADRPDAASAQLRVAATARDREAASDAVRVVLAAYYAQTPLHAEAAQARAWNAEADQLDERRSQAAAARARLAEAQTQVTDATGGASAVGAAGLEAAWASAAEALRESRTAAQAGTRRLAALQKQSTPTRQELAALDEQAAAWLGRLRGLEAESSVTVWPPTAAAAARLRQQAELEAKLEARAQDTRVVAIGVGDAPEAGAGVLRAVRVSEATADADRWNQKQQHDEAVAAQLEPQVARMRLLTAKVQRLDAEVAQQVAVLAQLDAGPGVRLVEADGLVGAAPGRGVAASVWRDDRPTKAGLGAAIGLLVGALIAVLWFASDRRVRLARSGVLLGSPVPLLSAVPVAGAAADEGGGDVHGVSDGPGGQQVVAIQSVRAVLEGRMSAGDRSFALVGVASGSGTTSVAVGVAVSMALSGSRVLLIDLAWMQKPSGRGSDDDAARDGLGVDGVIQDLGYLEDEDRESMGASGEELEVGFGALLRGVSLRRSVVQTRVEGLAVLGAMGQAQALRREWAGRVSSRWLTRLLEVARRGGYAATILDAGSATGSVEGMLGCAAADGTVVVVSNDQTQTVYDHAVTRMRLVGAGVIGTVLNRSGARRQARKPLHGHRSATAHQANALGSTTGSGIFAAAIEARSGAGPTPEGRNRSTPTHTYSPGSQNTAAPMSASGDAVSGGAVSEGALVSGDALVSGEGFGGGEAFGVPMPRFEDPVTDAAASSASAASPAPLNLARPAAEVEASPTIAAGVDPVDERPAEVTPTPSRTPPTPASNPAAASLPDHPTVSGSINPAGPPPLDVHVVDEVMDQLVDHAIRTARQPRPAAANPPPADDASASTSAPPPTKENPPSTSN